MLNKLLYLTIGIVLLYAAYRILAALVLPRLNKRSQKRFEDQFYQRNPQIDRQKIDDLHKQQEDKTLIIEKRKKFLS